MNPKQLHLPTGEPANAWQCSNCKVIYGEREPYSSERCCICHDCKCVMPKDRKASFCNKCWGPHYAGVDADRLAKAELVENYDGPVCDGNRYWRTLDDYLDEMEEGEEKPFLHTCIVHHYQLDAESILQNMLENANVDEYEYGEVELHGQKELVDAIEAFNAANRGPDATTYWDVDYRHKVSTCRVESHEGSEGR